MFLFIQSIILWRQVKAEVSLKIVLHSYIPTSKYYVLSIAVIVVVVVFLNNKNRLD